MMISMKELEEKLFDQSWNYKNRDKIIKRLQETSFDILVLIQHIQHYIVYCQL